MNGIQEKTEVTHFRINKIIDVNLISFLNIFIFSDVKFTISYVPCNYNEPSSLGLLLCRRSEKRQRNTTLEYVSIKMYILCALCVISCSSEQQSC
jgi:hypothetical protein